MMIIERGGRRVLKEANRDRPIQHLHAKMAHQALVQNPKHASLGGVFLGIARRGAAEQHLPPPRLLRLGQRRVGLDRQHPRHQPFGRGRRLHGGGSGGGAVGAMPVEGGGDGGGGAGEAGGVPRAGAQAAEQPLLLRRRRLADHADPVAVARQLSTVRHRRRRLRRYRLLTALLLYVCVYIYTYTGGRDRVERVSGFLERERAIGVRVLRERERENGAGGS